MKLPVFHWKHRQSCLLALENKIIRRVGGTKEIKIDVRIIGAANQDLREMMNEGSFREDLFHRLDLLLINIPPLSSRGKDIAGLANHLLVSRQVSTTCQFQTFQSNLKNHYYQIHGLATHRINS